MKKILAITLMAFSGVTLAAAGDQTLSIGYIQVKSDGLKRMAELSDQTSRLLTLGNASGIDAPYTIKSDGYNDPKGMFIRYRYEFTDNLGIIGSFSYAVQDGATSGYAKNQDTNKTYQNKISVKGDYFSALLGPSLRINDYVSIYGLAGAAMKNYEYDLSHRYTSDGIETSRSNYNNSQTKTSLAYSLGAQFNVYQHLVVDAAYEGSSGGSDWKTNAFTVGLGYQF